MASAYYCLVVATSLPIWGSLPVCLPLRRTHSLEHLRLSCRMKADNYTALWCFHKLRGWLSSCIDFDGPDSRVVHPGPIPCHSLRTVPALLPYLLSVLVHWIESRPASISYHLPVTDGVLCSQLSACQNPPCPTLSLSTSSSNDSMRCLCQ